METQVYILIVATFIIAGLLVLAAAYMVIKKFFESEEQRRFYELKANNHRITLPIRLQAYERLTLLMERMSFNNLILRVKRTGMTATDLQAALIAEIRAEYEHNLSQQIYISNEAWELIVNAKENVAKVINVCYSKLPPNSSSLELSKIIFEFAMQQEGSPTHAALNNLKKEARELF